MPFWAKVEDTPFKALQVVFTNDQTCPHNGPGAVFATLVDNQSCVEMNVGVTAPGVSVFPHGGAAVNHKRENQMNHETKTMKRSKPKCKGLHVDSQEPSKTESIQVSSIVDCVNGASSGCTISESEQHTKSVTTSFSTKAGLDIEEIFSIETTFCQDYTQSSTTSISKGFSIPQGQKGYLSAYSAATLCKGKFTDCDSGPKEVPGQALVVKKNGFTYSVVLTGA